MRIRWTVTKFPGLCRRFGASGIAMPRETKALKAQFVEDANIIFARPRPYTSCTEITTVGSGKAGSALPPLTLSRKRRQRWSKQKDFSFFDKV